MLVSKGSNLSQTHSETGQWYLIHDWCSNYQ